MGTIKIQEKQGKLILDATCTPADISYPTDIKLLNQAREQTEKILDRLYEQVKDKFDRKLRTYRQRVRKDYLAISKQRRLRWNYYLGSFSVNPTYPIYGGGVADLQKAMISDNTEVCCG